MQENPSQRFLKAKVSGLLVKVWMTREEVLTHKPKYTQTDKWNKHLEFGKLARAAVLFMLLMI